MTDFSHLLLVKEDPTSGSYLDEQEQLRRFKALTLQEKLEATEELANLVDEFMERARKRKMKRMT